MPDNRISVELDLRLLDSSNAVQKLAELRTQLNGLGSDVERASRQQGWAGLRNIELGAQNIAAQVETIRQTYLPPETSVQNAPEAAPIETPPGTAVSAQQRIQQAQAELASGQKAAAEQIVAYFNFPPLDLQNVIESNLGIERPVYSAEASARALRRQLSSAQFLSPAYTAVREEPEQAAGGPKAADADAEYAQRLQTAIARQRAAESAARNDPFPTTSAEADSPLTVNRYVNDYVAGRGRDSKEHQQFAENNAVEIEAEFQRRAAGGAPLEEPTTPQARARMRDEARDSLPDPAKIAAVRAQIEQLTQAWNDLTEAQRKSGTGAAIQNMMGQARTQLQELNRVAGPSPESIARFDELIKKTDASATAIKRAQYEFNRGNIQSAESILTINSQLQREVDNQTKSRFSTTTIGDILKEQQSGSGRGGGGSAGSRGYTNRQADLSRAFGGGPEELGGFAAFRGINRAGALEIQAAIINSIQAAASGMSLGHVAMMESAQVGGGIIQGGLVTFGQLLSFLASPVGMVTAALTALGAATYAVIASMVNASNQIASGVNVAAAQGRNTGDARGNIESMANQVRLSGGLGRQESRSLGIAVNSIPNISEEARQSLLGSGEAASRVFFGGDLKKTEETFQGFGDPAKLKAFIDQFGLLHGAEKQAFDDAVAIGDGLTASSIGARAIAEQLKPASSALRATREEMGTLGRTMDFFGLNFEAQLNRRLGHGGPFAGFQTAEFPSGLVRPPETQIQGDIAAERTLKTESEINGLIRQRANLQAAVVAQPDNERYQRALLETEYRIRSTRTPEEQRERALTGATVQTQAQQARVAAQIDPSAARGIAAAAKVELDDIVAHEQSVAATRLGLTAELTSKRIEAEQRYRDAVRETQQIILAEEISRLALQRAERPADVGFQRQVAESAFDVTVRNPSSTQTQRDERMMEVIKARQQEDLETQNVVITQIRANMALAEARGDLEEIVRLRQQENEIIQSRPDIRSRLERATSQAETERVERIQVPQRELGREIGRIGVERALNAPDTTFQRVALERELNALIASGLSTEEQRLQKITEIVNARRQERLEAENLRVAQMAQTGAILQYQQNYAGIVDLRRQEAAIIQSSADRTPLEKVQAQTQLIQSQIQALHESVRLEEQFVQSANRFTSQRAQTQTAGLNYQVETGAIRPDQALQAEQAINSQVFAQQRARLQTLLQDQALQPSDRARINSELAGLYEQDAQKQIELQTRITAAVRQENERRIENMKAFFKDVESGVTDAFAGVISGQKKAADAFKDLRQNLISSFIKNAEEMLSKAAGKGIASSLGVNLKEGEDSSISSVLSKALGNAIGLTKPEPKIDQATVAQKMQRAGELQQQAGEMMLKAAQSASNVASQAPLNARTGRPPDTYTPERTPTRSIDEIPRRLYDTKAQPGVVGGASSVEATRVVPQTYETDNAIGEGVVRVSPTATSAPTSDVHEAISRAEGTFKNGAIDYNAIYGNGKFGEPPKPLTDMTLAEVRDFGHEFGPRTGVNTSAMGAFQIQARSTMLDAAHDLNLDLNTTKFTPEVQRSMADWVREKQGFGAWEGFKSHPEELANARTAVTDDNRDYGGSSATAMSPSLNFSAFGDSLAAHLIRKTDIGGSESGRVGLYQPGNTAVSGYNPEQILDVIRNAPASTISGKDVILSSGTSNDPRGQYTAKIGDEIDLLKTRGAQSVTMMGVGSKYAERNAQLEEIALQHGANFSGPLREVAGDQIHSRNPAAELTAIREAATPGTINYAGEAPVTSKTVGDLLSDAGPRYRDVTGGQDIKADFERAWGHPFAEMSTARRIQSALGDEQLKPMALQANEAIQTKYPGLDIESAFKAGKPSLDELRAIPLRERAAAAEPIKVDPTSVAQGVAQGEQQRQQQATTNAPIADGAASTNAAVEQLDQSATAAGASLQSVADASAPTASSFQTAATDATAMGDSLSQAGSQAVQAGQQFQQAGTQTSSSGASGGTSAGASSSSSGGLLSGVGELASVATAVSALTGTKTSPIVREVTAGISLISSITKMFSSGGLLGGLFGGGSSGGGASGGSSAFGGIGSLFSGFTSLFSLFAFKEGGLISSSSSGMIVDPAIFSMAGGNVIPFTLPSASGGMHVQETSLSSSIRSGLVNMAQSGNVIPFTAGHVTSSSGGHMAVNDGKGGRLGILHPNEMVVPAAETRIILNHLAHGSLTSSEGGFVVPSITGGSVSISQPSVSMPGRASLGVQAVAAANTNSASAAAPTTTTGGDNHYHSYSINVTSLDPRAAHRVIIDNADSVVEAYERKRRNLGGGGR